MSSHILGAYAAAPADLASTPDEERSWFDALAAEPQVGGLELPFDDGLHPDRIERLIALLDPSWSSVVTAMSGISTRLLTNPAYGLASTNDDSRRQAVRDIARARSEISAVRAALGPDAIVGIQLQSAPGVRAGTAGEAVDALSRSLAEILSWDWEGIAISLEHCDSPSAGHPPQKGFLPLPDEVKAVDTARQLSGAAIGHTVNWARSTIETRDVRTPVEQVASLAASGSLVGVMFSGVAPARTDFGDAWADAHLPVSGSEDGSEPLSLLNSAAISDTLRAAGGAAAYVGAKVSARKVEQPLLERLTPGFATLRALAESEPQ